MFCRPFVIWSYPSIKPTKNVPEAHARQIMCYNFSGSKTTIIKFEITKPNENDDTPYLLTSQLNVFVFLCKLVFFHKNMYYLYLLVLCLACNVVSCNYYALGPLKRTRTNYSPLNLIYTTSNNALSSSDSDMVANFC